MSAQERMCWWLSVRLHASWDISLLTAPPVRSEKRNNHCPGPPPCPRDLEGRGADVEREKCKHLCSGGAAGYPLLPPLASCYLTWEVPADPGIIPCSLRWVSASSAAAPASQSLQALTPHWGRFPAANFSYFLGPTKANSTSYPRASSPLQGRKVCLW